MRPGGGAEEGKVVKSGRTDVNPGSPVLTGPVAWVIGVTRWTSVSF